MAQHVGVLYHPKNSAAEALAHELEAVLPSLGASAWICSTWEEEEARAQVVGTNLLLSIGGDGTIMRAARIAIPWSVPIIGINLGKLGFMTELNAKEAIDKMPSFLAGEGWIDERVMLQAGLLSSEAQPSVLHALNDVVVGRGAASRVVYIKATIDGIPLTTYKADGVIAATATGSTAYSLSAGGPILHPQAKEMVLQPISAHLTLLTPLVLPPKTIVKLEIHTDHQAVLSIDGQVEVALKSGDTIKISHSPYTARFLRTRPATFFYRTLALRLTARSDF